MNLFFSVHGCQVKIDRAGLILLLLANGVKIDVKTTDEGLSSFMIACIMGDVQLAELLLARGASIHNTDKESKLLISLALSRSMQANICTRLQLELAFHGRLNSISSISEIPRVLFFILTEFGPGND